MHATTFFTYVTFNKLSLLYDSKLSDSLDIVFDNFIQENSRQKSQVTQEFYQKYTSLLILLPNNLNYSETMCTNEVSGHIILCPFGKATLNFVFGSNSVTSPSTSITSLCAISTTVQFLLYIS